MAAAARLIKPDVQLYHVAFHFGSRLRRVEFAQSTAEGEKKRELTKCHEIVFVERCG